MHKFKTHQTDAMPMPPFASRRDDAEGCGRGLAALERLKRVHAHRIHYHCA